MAWILKVDCVKNQGQTPLLILLENTLTSNARVLFYFSSNFINVLFKLMGELFSWPKVILDVTTTRNSLVLSQELRCYKQHILWAFDLVLNSVLCGIALTMQWNQNGGMSSYTLNKGFPFLVPVVRNFHSMLSFVMDELPVGQYDNLL